MEKLYFSIREVAEMLGVSQSLLRFWETEFDCIKPHKNKKGNRSYTEQDIEVLRNAVAACVPAKALEVNLKAFDMAAEMAKNAQ